MSSPAAVVHQDSATFQNRRLFYLLGFLALAYALFAGLHTVSDFDLGWHIATGRWAVQHHAVPWVDVLSYTAAGEPYIDTFGGGIVFYLAFLLGGYALISWIGAAACAGTVALLLRRGSPMSAAIAILAVPVIALRTTPRPDMFSVVLFAAFLSILWEQHRTGQAGLWLLPLLMLAWVNLHLGFVAGLGLLVAYVGAEVLEVVFDRDRRVSAMQRLREARWWLVATALVTLVNPYGWAIYRGVLVHERANSAQQFWISEWTRVPMTWTAVGSAFWLRQTQGAIYWLLLIAVVAGVLALWKRDLGSGVLLLAALVPAVRYARMGSVFACVVVIVAAPLLSSAVAEYAPRITPRRMRSMVVVVVTFLALIVVIRVSDLLTDRHYMRGAEQASFGPGLGWWFPERAAAFMEREKIPGQMFNTYNEGGFLAWRLGPQRLVYIDGRDTLFGVQRLRQHSELLQSSPDSAQWEQQIAAFNINSAILPLGRFDGIQSVRLQDFCKSKLWQPVYLDEVSASFRAPHASNRGTTPPFSAGLRERATALGLATRKRR